MKDWASTYGHTNLYTPGSYSLADFDAISRIMTQERAPERTFMTLDGHEIFLETENLLLDYFNGDYSKGLMQGAATAAGIPSDTFQPFENSDFDFYSGFKSVRKGGYNFVFKNLHEFSDAQGVGSSAYNYNQWRMIVPIGGERINRVDGKPGFMWGYEYKSLGGYNREVVYGNIAGVGVAGTNGFMAQPVNEYDRMKTGIVGEIAFHGACPNQSVIQRPE